VTGYGLAQAAIIPLAGWLSDRFGAKVVFLTSVALFTIESVLCATAADSTMLIAFRVLQGLGGGAASWGCPPCGAPRSRGWTATAPSWVRWPSRRSPMV